MKHCKSYRDDLATDPSSIPALWDKLSSLSAAVDAETSGAWKKMLFKNYEQ